MISLSKVKQLIEKEDEGPTLDYKMDLVLEQEGDKAEFVKDVTALANSGKVTHIIVGIEDKTRKLIGLKTPHTVEQLNDIFKNRCDPPISLEYAEKSIFGCQVGIIEILGENPPYLISVHDKFGGNRTCGEPCYIYRGAVYVRNNNKNEGAVRENIEKMYENKVKYVTVQADLQLKCSTSITHKDEYKEVSIDFELANFGDVLASEPFLFIHFLNIEQLTKFKDFWTDVTHLNPEPTAQCYSGQPVAGRVNIRGVTVRVKKDLRQINTRVEIYSTNMKTKRLEYPIPLDS